MARKKEFDKEEVLTKAMYAFLQHGYEATSMQTLVSAMGINRGSLYDTFGDKHSLFLQAIAHYEETIVKQTIACLTTPDASKQTIVDLFRNMVKSMTQKEKCYGCLITNTAIELCSHDAQAKTKVNSNFDRMTRAFKHALKLAQVKGEIDSQQDIDNLANYLTSNLQGLRVMGKVNPDRPTLNGIVDVVLSTLD